MTWGAWWLRWGRWSVLASAVLLPIPAALFVAWRTYRGELAGFGAHRHAVTKSPEFASLPGVEDVVFRSAEGINLRGWYVPSRNRAGLVLLHGAGTDRSEMLPEALVLAHKGFGVLVFDSPGHGESDGLAHWDRSEREALIAAVDWLSARPDVNPGRLGGYGFSMGGYVLAQVAGADARLRAVALASAPPDAVEHTRWEYRRWGALSQLPALWAIRRGGIPADTIPPKVAVVALAPRPLLVVAGSKDELVPRFMAKELFDAAGEPKEFLLVEGAGHGGYLTAAPSAFGDGLCSFFERSLASS